MSVLCLVAKLQYSVLLLLVSVLCLVAKLQYDITAVLRDNRAAANILSNMMEGLLD